MKKLVQAALSALMGVIVGFEPVMAEQYLTYNNGRYPPAMAPGVVRGVHPGAVAPLAPPPPSLPPPEGVPNPALMRLHQNTEIMVQALQVGAACVVAGVLMGVLVSPVAGVLACAVAGVGVYFLTEHFRVKPDLEAPAPLGAVSVAPAGERPLRIHPRFHQRQAAMPRPVKPQPRKPPTPRVAAAPSAPVATREALSPVLGELHPCTAADKVTQEIHRNPAFFKCNSQGQPVKLPQSGQASQ